VEADPVIGDWQLAPCGTACLLTGDYAGEDVSDCRPMLTRNGIATRGVPGFLAPDPEPGDQRPVPLDVVVLHVVEQAAPTTDELHQSAPGVVVSPVDLEVLGKVIDASSKERYLHLW
jgi:hypothetical protein